MLLEEKNEDHSFVFYKALRNPRASLWLQRVVLIIRSYWGEGGAGWGDSLL